MRRLRAIVCSVAFLATPIVGCAGSTPSSSTPSRHAPELAILDDDYPRALAEARATRRPIVAVTDAVWCDACREMRAVVLVDPQLVPTALAVVWVAIGLECDPTAAPLLDAARALLADASILASDRSALFDRVVSADRRGADEAATNRDARAWLAFLERHSATARSPAARASLDGARL